jgi:hypothetical protein
MKRATSRFFLRSIGRLSALLVLGGVLAVFDCVAAPTAQYKNAESITGIHVRRTGDAFDLREVASKLVESRQKRCGSPFAMEQCQLAMKTPGVDPKFIQYCKGTMSKFKLHGSVDDAGKFVTDEYFVPALGWYTKIRKINVLQGTELCEAIVGELEIHEIHHYTPAGRTKYERKSNKTGQYFWRKTTQTYSKELAAIVKAGLDAGLASDKFAVKKTGKKTYLSGYLCEESRITLAAGEDYIDVCLRPVEMQIPAAITFARKHTAKGKTVSAETVEAFEDGIDLQKSLFWPPAGEKVAGEIPGARPKKTKANPANATMKWCAAEKARTGVDPCEDDDE